MVIRQPQRKNPRPARPARYRLVTELGDESFVGMFTCNNTRKQETVVRGFLLANGTVEFKTLSDKTVVYRSRRWILIEDSLVADRQTDRRLSQIAVAGGMLQPIAEEK